MHFIGKEGVAGMTEPKIVFDHIHIISADPKSSATWYEEMLGGRITGESEIRGGLQINVAFKGVNLLVRGKRPGEEPSRRNNLQSFSGFVSHDHWGTDHFGFRVLGDLNNFCNRLKEKGVTFTVDPYDFVPGVRIAYIEAPDGVSIELVQDKQ